MHEVRLRAIEGKVSAQKVLLGSKIETRWLLGGTDPDKGSRQIKDFSSDVPPMFVACVIPE